MLFPLANGGDLYHFLRDAAPPKLTEKFARWLLGQMSGLCDAVRYLHSHELLPNTADSGDEPSPMRRIGFHHDLKPANILIYGTDFDNVNWKISDFGSGTVKYVSSTCSNSIYNRKASTGDPIYGAPEYLVDGKVSRPKDLWSLGCIFLEVLVWALDPIKDAVEQFKNDRTEFSCDSPDQAPTYWCQDHRGMPYLNTAVVRKLDLVGLRCRDTGFFEPTLETIRRMICILPKSRPTAVQLCEQFHEMM
ncbi:MAG: hypothetical protein M1836_001555 [Candelina mexicana]|nr:MAG: hypothetical protein M1836_001555 [Candelina mexicana]